MIIDIGSNALPINDVGISMSGNNDPNIQHPSDMRGYIGLMLYRSNSDMRYSDGTIDTAICVRYDGIKFSYRVMMVGGIYADIE